MQQSGVAYQQNGYGKHVQALIDTHLPLLEMLISRLISRNPQCCATIARLKSEQKPRREKDTTFPIYKGIISMYALEGLGAGEDVSKALIVFTIKTWFAEKIDILGYLSSHKQLFIDFDVDDDSVFITIVGPHGLSALQGSFIRHVREKFADINMPWHFGLDTQMTIDPQRYQRFQF